MLFSAKQWTKSGMPWFWRHWRAIHK